MCRLRVVASMGLAGLLAQPALALGVRSSAHVRVNQVGYVADASKRAFYLVRGVISGARFQVLDAGSTVVLTAPLGPSLGAWNRLYPRVYALDFSAVTSPGLYRVRVTGPTPAVSPAFPIDTAATLYSPLLPNVAAYYRAQRDGNDVDPSLLSRQPSHLADQIAAVHQTPVYVGGVLQSALVATGGTRDVSGGWFDAGDYIKLVATSSYTVSALLLALRDHSALLGGPTGELGLEARFGLDWLLRMWDDTGKTLYYQVGIGDGNGSSILGDHDFWRLPQDDDALAVTPGDPAYYVKYRPVLRAGLPGSKISPNLAGRLAAAFGLCFQVYRGSDPAYADGCLAAAEHVFDLAQTTGVTKLLTTAPPDYYPEEEWRDDLELGAVELYWATAAGSLPPGLPHSDPSYYLGLAAQWAQTYMLSPLNGSDSLNLYDVSGLAHYELDRALAAAGDPPGLAVTRNELRLDLQDQLDRGVRAAAGDPFGLGVAYDGGDVTPHALGFALLASLYHDLTGTTSYDSFGLRQLDWVLGGNPWGVSFVVGAGTTFPNCLHHQIANLSGSLDGTPPLLLGAVVNGPAALGELAHLSAPSASRACPPTGGDRYAPLAGKGAGFRDMLPAYPSIEPADDYVALTGLLLARQVAAPMGQRVLPRRPWASAAPRPQWTR
jgi:endoglucanase